jgi:hypothetical protein
VNTSLFSKTTKLLKNQGNTSNVKVTSPLRKGSKVDKKQSLTIDRTEAARKSSLFVNRVLDKVKESQALPRKASVSNNAKLIGSLICEGEGVKKKLNVPRLEIPIRSLDIASEIKPVAASERLNERSSLAALLIKA